ncbi:thioredoxin domain-containing protein [Natronolimnohabitans sp. A-GB9]|uniref:thioredoxin domain-containing protein n=1 Tax=Natronolimnohabitans sp. A-GB9 TaxID=3069757 RepID=UPI0027B6133D|nr:thioredoxin domain-containing protein [Natronolimnohabitans sp. A-GB9]MDQ2048980.1 thioredoxin domain-containing protein [Natronolimnohabitans sp. A-GB9]
MDQPTQRNRLDEEESPYLRQHADNPVNWQPWDEQALEAAREHDVPIFLSIGYSACHWCHVMEEESFADEEVAEVLNENFVPIKVDREERPDIDSIYMTVAQLVSGRGGWPLSAWLTPEGKPFYVGTYFPKEEKRGQPGFLDLCRRISSSWRSPDDREEMENRAEQWTDAAKDRLEETPDAVAGAEPPSSAVLETAADAAVRSADRQHGGFGSGGPKFPQPSRLRVLARAYDRTGRGEYLEVLEESLDAMAAGGLYDHVGGGFHRYCVDADWTVPHFEKMLYDNAEIPRAFLAGYQLTGDERYADVVEETLAFVDRELTHEEGGFFSTLDAQSVDPETGEREEGAFFVWTPDEVQEVLDDETTADLFCARYDITESGNFEGQNQPNHVRSIADLATEYDLDEDEIERRLEDARTRLFEAREQRPRPNRDEKVLAGWNGLLISTCAEAALVLEEEEYADMAVDALEFVRERLWDTDEKRLSRRFKAGDVAIDGYLEDYAFLARGAVGCYEATGDVDHLAFALELARTIEAEFWDDEAGTLYFTPESGESLVTRPQELNDQSTPSAAGVAVETLLTLDGFAEANFEDIAAAVLETHANRIETNALQHASLCLGADRLESGVLEVTVAADRLPDEWRGRFADDYRPDRLFALRPPTEEGLGAWLGRLGLEEPPAIWAGREARDGEPTLYVCRDRTCSPPTHDVEEALEWLDDTTVEDSSGTTLDDPESPF